MEDRLSADRAEDSQPLAGALVAVAPQVRRGMDRLSERVRAAGVVLVPGRTSTRSWDSRSLTCIRRSSRRSPGW